MPHSRKIYRHQIAHIIFSFVDVTDHVTASTVPRVKIEVNKNGHHQECSNQYTKEGGYQPQWNLLEPDP